jgi:Fe-S cluster biosynthesis and repair protein YggX
MKFENTDVWGFEHALRGMRNPKNSWSRNDSGIKPNTGKFEIGDNDLSLAMDLIKAGPEHRKFLRQIFVSVDITAPFYWWKEFDTYKVGTTANSCSTMHTLTKNPITIECFEMGDFEDIEIDMSIRNFWDSYLIPTLEQLRLKYLETKDKKYWKELVRILPESWLQKRTVTMNYENVLNMMRQREYHKLTEWKVNFMEWAKNLPHMTELTL